MRLGGYAIILLFVTRLKFRLLLLLLCQLSLFVHLVRECRGLPYSAGLTSGKIRPLLLRSSLLGLDNFIVFALQAMNDRVHIHVRRLKAISLLAIGAYCRLLIEA